MLSLLQLIDQYVFAGIPSNFAYDLIKQAWETANRKSWTEIYYEALKHSVDAMRDSLSVYADGEIAIDDKQIRALFSQQLGSVFEDSSLHELADDRFSDQLARKLAEREVLILGGHCLDEKDYFQLVFNVIRQARALFRETILQNEPLFRQELLKSSGKNMELLREIEGYLHKSHEIVLPFLTQIDNKLTDQGVILSQLAEDSVKIKAFLGIDRLPQPLLPGTEQPGERSKQGTILVEGLCKGFVTPALSDQYFVAQEFNPGSEDLKRALSRALQGFGMQPIRADDRFTNGHILCKICGLIENTPFGVYQLTKSQNRNVYLELGVSLGLEKPYVLVKEPEASVAPIMAGIEYYQIDSYIALQYEFGRKLEAFIAGIARYRSPDPGPADGSRTVFISNGDQSIVDFTFPLVVNLVERGFEPVILCEQKEELTRYLQRAGVSGYTFIGSDQGLKLDEVMKHITTSSFGIYCVDKICSADNFVALGIALSKNKPGILVHRSGYEIPSDLQGLAMLSYVTFNELENMLAAKLDEYINKYAKPTGPNG